MTTTVHAASITAPDAALLEFMQALAVELALPGQVLGAVDAVTGVAGGTLDNAYGAANSDTWPIDGGAGDQPDDTDNLLHVMVVEPGAIVAPGDDVLQSPASLAIAFEEDTVKGDLGSVVVAVVDPFGDDGYQLIDYATATLAGDGASTLNLGGLGLAAVQGLATGDALLVVGLISEPTEGTESTFDLESFTLTVPTGAGAAMGSNNSHAQTANCMLIAVELNEACVIAEGASTYVTAGVGKATPTVERTDGADYSAENFGGVVCGPDMMGDTQEKSITLEGEFCLVNWGFMAMTSGNPKIVDEAGNVIGYQQLKKTTSACETNDKPRIALTIIRKVGTSDGGCVTPSETTGAQGAVAVTYPNTRDWTWDIPPHENVRAVVPFKCKCYASPNPGRGPLNLYPAGATPAAISPSALHAEYFVDVASLPTIDDNAVTAHPAPLGQL